MSEQEEEEDETSEVIRDDLIELSDTNTFDPEGRFRWNSKFAYLIITAVHSISVWQLQSFYGAIHDINWFQYTICILFLGMPIMYMEVLIGQYTQRSALFMRNMCPIGQGIGYASMVIVLVRTLATGIALGDFFLYLINTTRKVPPWFKCTGDGCWNGSYCKPPTPCLDAGTMTSCRIYWNSTFMTGIEESQSLSGPHFRRLSITCLVWILLNIPLLVWHSIRPKVLMYVLVPAISFLFFDCITLCCFCENPLNALNMMFDYMKVDQLNNVTTWVDAATNMIVLMNLGKGTHILYASYLTITNLSAILCVCAISTFYLIAFIFKLLFYLAMNCIMQAAHVDDWKFICGPVDVLNLTVIPFSFGQISSSQLWLILYFTGNILACGCYIIISLIYVDQTVLDAFGPPLVPYRKYYICINLAIFCILSFILTNKGMHVVSFVYLNDIYNIYEILVTFLITLIVCWVYGLQKFNDDIQFMYGNPPMTYWTICWRVSPLFIGALLCLKIYTVLQVKFNLFTFTILVILFLIIIIFAAYEMFIFMLRRKLSAVFACTDVWGPPDAKINAARKQYDPRMETMASTSIYRCEHKCLVDSAILKIVAAEEARVRSSGQMATEVTEERESGSSLSLKVRVSIFH